MYGWNKVHISIKKKATFCFGLLYFPYQRRRAWEAVDIKQISAGFHLKTQFFVYRLEGQKSESCGILKQNISKCFPLHFSISRALNTSFVVLTQCCTSLYLLISLLFQFCNIETRNSHGFITRWFPCQWLILTWKTKAGIYPQHCSLLLVFESDKYKTVQACGKVFTESDCYHHRHTHYSE